MFLNRKQNCKGVAYPTNILFVEERKQENPVKTPLSML